MHFPAFFPDELRYAAGARSDDELFRLLLPKTDDLMLFFEIATDDETWSEEHLECLRLIVEWLTTQALADRLSAELCLRAALAIRKHFSIISSIVPLNIHIQFSDGEVDVNSLLLSAASDFFRQVLLKECRDKEKNALSFRSVSKHIFLAFQHYICTGSIPDLGTKGKEEIVVLLRQALAWEVTDVAEMCEKALIKYITSENVFEMLFLSQQERWLHFTQGCIQFINNHYASITLFSSHPERLGCEFKNFSDEALEVFQRIKTMLTDIGCSGKLIEYPTFVQILKECHNLLMLDISGTASFSDLLYEVPRELQELNLSQCSWLSQATLKRLSGICPHLQSLWVCSNIQLNFSAWGELIHFKELKKIDLSRCHQIKNDDLAVILKARSGIVELALEECKRINDTGFFALAKSSPRLTTLNISRCSVTDSALVEIASHCRFLVSLNISRCEQVTEKGVLAMLKQAPNLKEIDLTHCRFASSLFEEIRKLCPRLIIRKG